jgi:helicase MOV-10
VAKYGASVLPQQRHPYRQTMAPICPQLLSTGSCGNSTCEFTHNVHICELCQVVVTTESTFRDHLRGKVHKKNASGPSNFHLCMICNTAVGRAGWRGHLKNPSHLRAAENQGLAPNIAPEEVTSLAGHQFCAVCNVHIVTRFFPRHLRSRRHLGGIRFAAFKTALDDAEGDKHGITVSTNGDLGIEEIAASTRGRSTDIIIENTVPRTSIKVVEAKLESSSSASLSP